MRIAYWYSNRADLSQPWTPPRNGLSLLRHTLAGIERCGSQVQRCTAQREASPRPPPASWVWIVNTFASERTARDNRRMWRRGSTSPPGAWPLQQHNQMVDQWGGRGAACDAKGFLTHAVHKLIEAFQAAMLGALLSDPGIEVGHRRRREKLQVCKERVWACVWASNIYWSCDFLTGECKFSRTRGAANA